ncbi:MAG: hypothetical protein DRJ03_20735 [Chloroflexi bacterium]|nr:MAG: hypothetical protein DRJ03_20735 [Chloroflexota bacterium]
MKDSLLKDGYTGKVFGSTDSASNRIMIGIPMTGTLRAEWVLARYGQVIPCNWSQVDCIHWLDQWSPIGFLVADARNVIATACVEQGFEWCFKGCTEVETSICAKPIKDIKVGEYVKTHKGRLRMVTKVMKRDYSQRSPLVRIKTANSSIKCTPEHPFYAITEKAIGLEWVKAKDLKSGDALVYPDTNSEDRIDFECSGCGNTKKDSYREFPVDTNLARFFGLYLAEGCAEKDSICFTFHNKEAEYIDHVSNICRDIFKRKPTIRKRWATHVKINIRPLADRFRGWFGTHAHTKVIPDFVFGWNLRNRLAFIKGYLDGDGSNSGGGSSFISASKKLLDGFEKLCSASGLKCTTYGYIPPSEAIMKDGHIIKNKGAYMGRVSKRSYDKLLDLLGAVRSGQYLLMYVQSVKDKWQAASLKDNNVYNLEVEEDNSYIAGSVTAHNCFFIDHDTILPPDTILKFNDRMLKADVPIISGLYFTKSVPSEPLIYRGRGNSYYNKWKFGDEVWVDAVPNGCTLIHASILKVLYDESEEYVVKGHKVRRIYETPARSYFDPETQSWFNSVGTEDLAFCTRVMKDNIFKKAGWPKFQRKKYPFLIDTSIFCKHIDNNGIQYPANGEEQEFIK